MHIHSNIDHSVFLQYEITKPEDQTTLGQLSRPRGHAHRFLGFGRKRTLPSTVPQRLTAGIAVASDTRSLIGTMERRSAVPAGLGCRRADAHPAMNRWAIFAPSLRHGLGFFDAQPYNGVTGLWATASRHSRSTPRSRCGTVDRWMT